MQEYLINISLQPRGFVKDPKKAKKIAKYKAKDKSSLLNKI